MSKAEGVHERARRVRKYAGDAQSNRHRAYFGSRKPFGLVLGGQTVYIVSDPADVREVFRNGKGLQFPPIIEGLITSTFGLDKSAVHKLYDDVPGDGKILENSHAYFMQYPSHVRDH